MWFQGWLTVNKRLMILKRTTMSAHAQLFPQLRQKKTPFALEALASATTIHVDFVTFVGSRNKLAQHKNLHYYSHLSFIPWTICSLFFFVFFLEIFLRDTNLTILRKNTKLDIHDFQAITVFFPAPQWPLEIY